MSDVLFLTGTSVDWAEALVPLGRVVAVTPSEEARHEAIAARKLRRALDKSNGPVDPETLLIIGVGSGSHRVTLGGKSVGRPGGYKTSFDIAATITATVKEVCGNTPIHEILAYAGCFHRCPKDPAYSANGIQHVNTLTVDRSTALFDVLTLGAIPGIGPATRIMATRVANIDGTEHYINYAESLYEERFGGEEPRPTVYDVGSGEVGYNGAKAKHDGSFAGIVEAIASFRVRRAPAEE
jgi:hypothetical protein